MTPSAEPTGSATNMETDMNWYIIEAAASLAFLAIVIGVVLIGLAL